MTLKINNRRYIGNKTKLLEFISECMQKENIQFKSFGDVFSGTGVVAEYFFNKGKDIYVNDLLYSNFVIYNAWFSKADFSEEKIKNIIVKYNEIEPNDLEDNYFSYNFSDTYYEHSDAKKIGYIRENIEEIYRNEVINDREKYILITSLIYSMDKIANTVGHYESFLNKKPEYKDFKMHFIEIGNYTGKSFIFNQDANNLVKNINVDVMYLDPPYNARQYANFYHLIENVAKWEKPEVFDKARKMERKNIMSEYGKSNAKNIFKDLIENINAKYIIVSYNNTYEAKSISSINTITYEDMMEILESKGETIVYEQNYKFFNSGKTDFKKHLERIFICKIKK